MATGEIVTVTVLEELVRPQQPSQVRGAVPMGVDEERMEGSEEEGESRSCENWEKSETVFLFYAVLVKVDTLMTVLIQFCCFAFFICKLYAI